MDNQIKELDQDPSICFETSGDDLGSLTLIERYNKYLQQEEDEDDDDDSEGDYDEMKSFLNNLLNDLKDISQIDNNHRRISMNIDLAKNNYVNVDDNDSSSPTSTSSKSFNIDIETIEKLIESLNLAKKNFENTVTNETCEEAHVKDISEKYGDILDYIYNKTVSSLERLDSLKELDDDCEDFQILAEKIDSVHKARDKYVEVEQEVREQVEQLELVERYKMESVG